MKMDRRDLVRAGICFLFCLALPLAAQWPEEGTPARERMRENINRLRLLRMTEELDLTPEQTAIIFPVATRLEKEKAELSKKIGQEIRNLRALVRVEKPDEQELARKVKAIKELRRSILEKDLELERILEANLTGVQKAKYLLFSLDFYRLLGEKLDRARKVVREKRDL